MSFKQQLNDYFDLHTRERKGLISLLCILAVLFGCMALAPYIFKPSIEGQADLEAQMNKILHERDSLQALKSAENKKTWDYSPKKEEKYTKKNSARKELFRFDPNTISDSGWKKLGFNSGQIKTINNYKNKGGKFFKPIDVAKLYCVSEEQYQELKPFINIAKAGKADMDYQSKDNLENTKTEEKNSRAPLFIDINSADTSALKSLSGIGPFYANKIVTFREELGGFQHLDQLLEIWNFTPETLDKIKDQIHIGDGIYQKVSVNYCTVEMLKNHPYINWTQAKAVIAYRDQHGFYESLDDLEKSHLITTELCQKLKPYLKLEE